MAFVVVNEEILIDGLTEIADLIRAELGMQEPIPFPEMMAEELGRAFRRKNADIQSAKDETKALIERTTKNINNEDVVRVAPFSFYGNTTIKTADFPNAASAGESAFEKCVGLTSVKFDNAGIIGKSAFNSCTSLTSVKLPNAYEIRDSAFSGCTNLKSVNLPLVKTLGQYIFEASGLTSVILPSAKTISGSSFRKATNLKTVDLPIATKINANAFDTCTSLESVSAPEVQTLGQYAFAGCTSLVTLDLPKVTSIANHAFRKASSLSTLYLRNDSVVELADVGAFYDIRTINIYVPANLIESYQTDKVWRLLFDDQDRSVSFLPIPTTANGIVYFSIIRYGNLENYQAEEGMTWAQWCESEYNTSDPQYYDAGWGITNDWGDEMHYYDAEIEWTWDMPLVAGSDVIQATTYITYCP